MEYQALYRKYRPQVFDEVVGQDHVTTTLSREVAEGKVAHAYLFAGPRGTGKTTSARILAKALNCQNPPGEGEPCNECNSCMAIVSGSSFDVTELDAASHNSVDDIRDIKVSVTTVASVGGAKRVFILDEAHMLSKAAANALLKTLEEPPEHVHFVLATTEPYKLLDTIRSRSQRFDFHPVSIEELVSHLTDIAGREGYEVADGALSLVARHAGGSVRDSLSLLEQVAALGGGTIDASGVNRALGLADRDVYRQLATAVGENDAKIALELVANLAAAGVDLRRFLAEGIAFFRGVFLAHYAPNLDEVADEPADILADWRAVAAELPVGDVIRAMDVLSDGLIRLREGREERLMTEITLLKLTRPEVAADAASLQARMDTLERRLAAIGRQSAAAPAATPVETPGAAQAAAPVAAPTPPKETPTVSEPAVTPLKAVPDLVAEEPPTGAAKLAPAPAAGSTSPASGGEVTLDGFKNIWPAVSARIKQDLGNRRHALFREARPGHVDGATLVMVVPAHMGFHLEQLSADSELVAVIAEVASGLLGSGVSARFETDGDGSGGGSAVDNPTTTPSAPATQPVEESRVDKEDLMEDTSVADPMALLEDMLGATEET